MVKLLHFDDCEAARSPRRLILFNHIPKTGGTTLAYILKQGLDFTLFPLYQRYGPPVLYHPGASAYCPLEDYRDWARLRGHPMLEQAPDIFLEGNVWGAENLVPQDRKAIYVTMLRDPFKVFRSNFSYLIRHKHMAERDLESFLDNHWAPNFLTRHLGDGDLNLAIARLERTYGIFGVTEHFKQTARLFAGFFDFEIERYTERNKSNSEQYELPVKAEKRFWKMNRYDEYLYKHAEELFLRRVDNADFLAALPGVDTIVEERSEVSYLASTASTYDVTESIQAAFAAKDYEETVRLILSQEAAPIGDFLLLARCYIEQGNLEKAGEAYLEAFDWRASENIDPVLNFLFEHFPEDLIGIAEREMAHLEDLIFDVPADTFTYHDMVAYTDFLSSAYIKVGRFEDAIRLLDRELARMEERGLCRGVGGYYDGRHGALTARKADVLARLDPAGAVRILWDLICRELKAGRLHRYPWRKIVKQRKIVKHILVRGAPVLVDKAIRRLRRVP